MIITFLLYVIIRINIYTFDIESVFQIIMLFLPLIFLILIFKSQNIKAFRNEKIQDNKIEVSA